jgi:two-component system alkaline phosphatase synthesis response regulator PhoP
MRNVLIIGQDAAAPLAEALRDDGFDVTMRPPGDAPEDLEGASIALLVISEVGEDAGARKLLDGAQSGESPPIILVVSRGELERFDPTTAADDFFVLDGDPKELIARVRQLLWKRHQVDALNILKCGNLTMDLANYTVHVGGQPVDLTYKEYELLRFLATNPDRVFGRDQLLNKVWGYDFYGGARTVDVHIRRLRAKIEDKHATFIETVRNVGYRFRAKPYDAA